MPLDELVIGSRWFWGGRHYTVLGTTKRDVLLVPDAKPGVPRKPMWLDWLKRELAETLMADGRMLPSGQ